MKKRKSKIRFFSNGLYFSLKNRTKLKLFLEDLAIERGRVINSINYVFCTDSQLKKLNATFLNHDYYTDILTFDLSSSTKEIVAEIFISIPRVRENAKKFNCPFYKELQRVMIHGLLHLCGYNDKTKSQKFKMRLAEEKYLSRL